MNLTLNRPAGSRSVLQQGSRVPRAASAAGGESLTPHPPPLTPNRVLGFLGLPVPPEESPAWSAMAAAGPRRSSTETLGWMPEGARRVLSKLYEPHNVALAELLGDESWLRWNVDLRSGGG